MRFLFLFLILVAIYCSPKAEESDLPLAKLIYAQSLCYWDTSNWDGCNWE